MGSGVSYSLRGNKKSESTVKVTVASPKNAETQTEERPKALTILHFNDVYNVEPRQKHPVGGLSRFVTRIKQLREEALSRGEPEALVLFSGDAYNPSITSTTTHGKHMVQALNYIGIDVACYGNHDFDFGLDHLVDLAKQNNFPWLMSNVTYKKTGRALAEGERYKVLDIKGRRIGIIGLVEEEWLVTLATLSPEEVIFEDFCVCGHRMALELREKEKVELVVALTHMRVPNDEKLACEVPEIDVILGGHDHHYDVKPVGPHGTWVLKSGTDFRDITVLQLQFTDTPGAKPFVVAKAEHVEIGEGIAEDADVKPFVEECIEKVGAAMDNCVGKTDVDLDSRFACIRTKETNIGNFVADVMRKKLKTDLAFINSGTLRADSIIAAGILRMRDLVNLLPMLDEMCVLELSGLQVMKVLENSVSQYPRLEGRFVQVSGIKFTFDAAKPAGERIVVDSVLIDGKALEKEKKYTVATKDYLRSGKDGYDVFKEVVCLADGEQTGVLPNAVREHLEAVSGPIKDDTAAAGIKPEVEGRIVCLNPVE